MASRHRRASDGGEYASPRLTRARTGSARSSHSAVSAEHEPAHGVSFVKQTFQPSSAWTSIESRDDDDDDDARALGCARDEQVSKTWQALAVGASVEAGMEAGATACEPLLGAPPRASRLDAAALSAQRFCAFVIMSVLLVVECVPFGLAFFPLSWTDLPVPRALGIQMFLLSSAIAQATFAATSRFESATGLMMCENIPFMKQIASSVHATLAAQGREEQALPTVLACFALSTAAVGCAFYALGALRLGSAVSLIPPYAILGCVGGIGVFIVQTGLEISTGLTFAWSAQGALPFARGAALARWSLSLALALCLRLLGRRVRSPLLTPVFFVCVPLGFHAALLAARVRYDAPELAGWFFEAEPTPDWRLLWRVYARGGVAWDALPSQLGTFAALTLFSLAHIPINIPSLAMTTDTIADVDVELRAHGLANLLSALSGGVPNYLCYSNSALYHKCGGGGAAAGGALAAVQLLFFAIGPSAIRVLPRCMAGALLLHMGLELVREAVVAPCGGSLDWIEYTAVCLIAAVMVFAGMTEGLLVSALLCLLTFVLQASRAPLVCQLATGRRLRSSAWRSVGELAWLDRQAGARLVLLGLRGSLFFGNFHQLAKALADALAAGRARARRDDDDGSGAVGAGAAAAMLMVVINMAALTGLDSAAAQALEKTCADVRARRVAHLVLVLPTPLAGGCRAEDDPAYARLFRAARRAAQQDAPLLHLAPTVDGALAWCEERLLAERPGARAEGALRPAQSSQSLQAILAALAQRAHGAAAAGLHGELLAWFALVDVPEGAVLWREGDEPERAVVLLSGRLGARDEAGSTQQTDVAGCMLGEFGLLTAEPRQNTVRALTDCRVYELTRARWLQMQAEAPQLATVLATVALKYAGNRLRQLAFSAQHASSAVSV